MEKDTQATEQTADMAHLNTEAATGVQPGAAPMEDAAVLAKRLRHGEQAAATELVDRYYQRIFLFMRAVGHDRQISEDLTQETFLRAWYHIGQLRDGKALNGWLFRIAGNVSRLHRRRLKGKDSVSLDSIETPVGGADGSLEAGQQEQLDRVQQAVQRLPWKLRQAVVLHYMEQLTIAEAADAAGIREGTLKSRLNRGLEALRKNVTDE
jgi:RNA polymerase sigma-70 factor (ECF subfamily)